MASSTAPKVRAMLVMMMVILFAVFIDSEARILWEVSAMQKNDNGSSQLLLRKLGYDPSKLENYRRSLDAKNDRVAPGGPDGQHHFSQPPVY
ncbi:CLAVATA3/ESR (CLE)-related protein 5-like [Cornus florida]|uniref:CLAVATA3/ESR (CLE)-related protein 5-like n=1 Tax=Cornus florida TaxID=4283 RepID=UPI00289B70FE|nr:CLAVATA3/ESR (CLE)-related protein 5-like [Cornus florida]